MWRIIAAHASTPASAASVPTTLRRLADLRGRRVIFMTVGRIG